MYKFSIKHFFFILMLLSVSIVKADNLSTCLSGKYPSLCNKSVLTDAQRVLVDKAERTENLNICMQGKYPSLCKKNLLTQEQLTSVYQAERRENLAVCLAGRYTSLCNHSLLTQEEVTRVRAAERRENLSTCMTGRYPSLCNKSLLSQDELKNVFAAEKRVQAEPAPRQNYVRRQGSCESGHWVDSVSSNGEIVKLEDGSVWQIDIVDQIDTGLWLPTTDIVVCPNKLINTEDNESASVIRIR